MHYMRVLVISKSLCGYLSNQVQYITYIYLFIYFLLLYIYIYNFC